MMKFPRTPKLEWGTISAANTAKDGTGTVVTVLTAGSNGTWVRSISVAALGTNVATLLRIFANNGSTNATPANNILLREFQLPASTLSETTQQVPWEIPINKALPNGYKLNVTLGTAVAAGYAVSANGGDYDAD
jgi:hypothetical protein